MLGHSMARVSVTGRPTSEAVAGGRPPHGDVTGLGPSFSSALSFAPDRRMPLSGWWTTELAFDQRHLGGGRAMKQRQVMRRGISNESGWSPCRSGGGIVVGVERHAIRSSRTTPFHVLNADGQLGTSPSPPEHSRATSWPTSCISHRPRAFVLARRSGTRVCVGRQLQGRCRRRHAW